MTACGPHAKEENDCMQKQRLLADRTLARGPHAECTRHAETSMKYRKYEVPESLSVTTVCPQLLFAVCPQLLFALSYCLPSTTVCPQLLFALNHCSPSTAVCLDYCMTMAMIMAACLRYDYDCDCDYGADQDRWMATAGVVTAVVVTAVVATAVVVTGDLGMQEKVAGGLV